MLALVFCTISEFIMVAGITLLDRRWINHATNGNHLTTSRVFLVLYGIRSPKKSVQIKAIRNGAKNTVIKKFQKEAASGSLVEHSETAEFPVLPER